MKKLRRWIQGAPLFLPLLAVCGAIPGAWWWLISLVAVLLPCVCRLWKIALCASLCSLVAGLHSSWCAQLAQEFRDQVEECEVVEVRGLVERSLRRGCVLSTGWNGVRVVVRGDVPYKTGDEVRVRGLRQESLPPGVKGVFSSETWMREQGIAASLDFVDGEKLGKTLSLRTLQYWGIRLQEHFARRLMTIGGDSGAVAQVLTSLVLGDKSGAESETMETFRNGGCLHAFAVSGLHVGLVSGILWLLLRALRVRPVVIRPLVLLSVGVYVLMTGCAVPALRAYMMLAVLLLGYILRRRVSLLNTWSFAALLILLVAPSQLYNAGFQLSFGVYAAICLAVQFCMQEKAWFGPDDYIPISLRTRWEVRWSNLELCVRGAVIVSLSAWLVSVPITLYSFHAVNALSFLTNMAITPLLPVVMFFGLLYLCVGCIPWLGSAVAWAAYQSAALLLGVVSWFGELPYAYLPAQEPAPLQSIMVQGTGYGGSFTMLGNHGLLIDCGSESTAETKTFPTLFHAGYTPAVLLVSSPRQSSGGGAAVLVRMWPGMRVIHAHELPQDGCVLETQAGRFTIFAPPSELLRTRAVDYHPIVLWESASGRVLYVGDASYAAYRALPECSAAVAVLGQHRTQPVHVEDVEAPGILLLPSYGENENTGIQQCIPVGEGQNLILDISAGKLSAP